MKFSENWLRTLVNPAMSSDELSHLLTMAGLEVEGMDAVAPAFNNVVVAEVLEVIKHPNADRLNICQVNIGGIQPLTIVCGAANVAAGVKVPCARIGAVLPGDFNIKQAKVRGIESFGMLCSAKELGLAESSDGLWLLPDDAPVGTTLRDYLELDDHVFTLKLTPNRGDCSSLLGIAREVSALTASPCTPPAIEVQKTTLNEQLKITVADATACPAYYGRLVHGVNAAVGTPAWMRRRLERSGQRPINAVVDITNYVMLEMGQPMHAFDAKKLSGGVTVRRATPGESLTLLNEQAVQLDESVLVIADDVRVLAMAGIMGEKNSGVGTPTTDVFLESAFFHPDAIAGRARRFGLATDSSFRFERGVDFSATRQALERATQLLVDICGGRVGEISAACGALPARPSIALRRSRVVRILGIDLSNEQIAALLARLQFAFNANGDDYRVTPPSFRFDLSIEADLVEELARLYGYDNIPAIAPKTSLTMLPCSESRHPMSRIQQTLVARDYQEIVSLAFIEEQVERDLCGNPNPLALQNPIASNLAVMRSSLIGGLVDALRFNLNRKQTRVRLFEAGACFAKIDGNYVQTQHLSGIAYGTSQPEQWGFATKTVDFYDVKADVAALFAPLALRFVAATHPALHPGRCAQIHSGQNIIGWLGELHPQWQQQYGLPLAPIWFELELDALLQSKVPRMQEIAKFLPVRRDIAVLVDESVTVHALLDAMTRASAPMVQEIALFDLYRGKGLEPGKKSLAFRVLLQDTHKTSTDTEIETSIAVLVDALHQQGAQLRS
ncbi:MAG: phenylalanine--tRNA ligase subunit beta [Gallionella sp.]|nr:phenylalanine--tRNA ligase subunit beta [Gallionella sp.]